MYFTSKEEFVQILEDTVSELISREIPKVIRRASRKEYLTTAEFKELTSYSYRAQHYLRKERQLPYTQQGRKILYRSDDVEKFMEDRRIKAKGEV